MKELTLVLKCEWYDKIESGAKTHEYREIKTYWMNRLTTHKGWDLGSCEKATKTQIKAELWEDYKHITFMRAYTATKMKFKIKQFSICTTAQNDLGKPCIDIELGNRIA